jgi:hypothetical protein
LCNKFVEIIRDSIVCVSNFCRGDGSDLKTNVALWIEQKSEGTIVFSHVRGELERFTTKAIIALMDEDGKNIPSSRAKKDKVIDSFMQQYFDVQYDSEDDLPKEKTKKKTRKKKTNTIENDIEISPEIVKTSSQQTDTKVGTKTTAHSTIPTLLFEDEDEVPLTRQATVSSSGSITQSSQVVDICSPEAKSPSPVISVTNGT